MTKKFNQLLQEELDKHFLKEGLISSYDISKLVDKVLKIINKKVQGYELTSLPEVLSKTKYGKICTSNVFLTSPLSSEETKEVKKVLNLFGYTNSVEMFDDLQLQLEPKFPVKVNEFIEKHGDKTLFHVTRKKVVPKIEKFGLVPKLTQTDYDHPGDRIYLVWLPNIEKKGQSLAAVANMLARNKKIAYEDLAIIVTDYNPLSNYYLDDTTTKLKDNIIALFTTNNIPPTNIKKVINLNVQKPS